MKRILLLLSIFCFASTLQADDVQGIFYNPTLQEFQGTTRANGIVGFQQGRTNGVAACQGCVNEVISSITTANFTTSYANLTTITLTPGNWEISATATYNGAAGNSYIVIAISTNSQSISGTTVGYDQNFGTIYSAGGIGGATIPVKTVSITTPTIYYLVGEVNAVTGAGGVSLVARRR